MPDSKNNQPDDNSNSDGRYISRKDFLKQSVTTAGFLALSRNKIFGLSASDNPFKDSPEIRGRVNKLISKMTLKEKVSQLLTSAPAIPRLGIPKYNWWSECLHGVARAGLATSFPQSIGMAASWNTPLMYKVSTAISDEARAKHSAFIKEDKREMCMGLTFFAPNINLVRDPRWGRGQETYGEDPFLTGSMAKSFITGLQGDNPKYLKLVATAKHFAAYNGPEPLRNKINENISNFDLFDTYLPAFETSVKDAGVASIMCAYNSLNGMPCCGNNRILNHILRHEWNFDGYVVSDCGALSDFYNKIGHHTVKTPDKAAALGLTGGTDLNCGGTFAHLDEAELKGLVNEREINRALRRLFTARFRLGMFDPTDEVPYAQIPYSVVNSEQHQKLALQMARESIVLLKNEPVSEYQKSPLLPLSPEMKSIAVIGPNADNAETLLGDYYGTPSKITTPLQGIRDKVSPHTTVRYAQGSEIADGMHRLLLISPDMLIPSKGNGHGLYGEYFGNDTFSGTPAFTRIDKQINFTWLDDTPVTHKMAADFSVRWTGKIKAPKSGTFEIGFNGKNKFKIYFEHDLKINTTANYDPVQKSFKVNLEAGKIYDIRIDYSNSSPDPQAHLIWKEPDVDLISQAVEAARKSDVVVLCLGLNSHLEGEEMPIKIDGFDGGDRTKLVLPQPQVNLMKTIYGLGKPTVLVLITGSAVAIPWAKGHIPAILEAWYGGQAGGTAIADVLFGDYNPAGRLPVTFYTSVDDLPPFTDYTMKNRTYRYYEGEPLFPFGYGLSYTSFNYSRLIMPEQIKKGDSVDIGVNVTNTGKRKGDEVVQVYLDHLDYKGKKSKHALKGLKRISLEPGETKKVIVHLRPIDLAVVDEQGKTIIPSGRIKVSIGGQQPGLSGDLNAYTTGVIEEILRI